MLDDQPGQPPVDVSSRHTHTLDLLANVVESFGEKNHTSYMKNIQRIEAMCEIEKRVSELNDVKGLNQNVGR